MTIKGNKIIDLITGDYTGRWPQEYKTTENGKKPLIRPSGWNSMQVFPVPLDPEENVEKFTTDDGETVHVLVPDSNIYNFNERRLKNTPWFKLDEEREASLADKDAKIEELKDEKAELQDELDELKDSDKSSKSDSGTGSNSARLRCMSCDRVNSVSEWDNSDGMCPWCQNSSKQEAMRV